MRKTILITFLLALSASLFAGSWLIGLEGGYTLGLYDQRCGNNENIETSFGSAFELAFPVEYRFDEIFSLSFGMRYIGKAYNISYFYEGEEYYSLRRAEHMIELPLSLRLSLEREKARVFIGAGGYVGIRFVSTESGIRRFSDSMFPTDSEFWGSRQLNPAFDNLLDAGLLFEAGMNFIFGNGNELAFKGRYQRSLTELDRNLGERGHIARYLDTLSIVASYSWEFGGEK